MDLNLTNKTIAVGGTTGGLGHAITDRLIAEGATVVGFARSRDKLNELAEQYGDRFIPHVADVSDSTAVRKLAEELDRREVTGCVLNAGGPPTGGAADLRMEDWDRAYALTLRWKIQLTRALLPGLRERGYGRLVFVESVSIKQPIANLALSNVFRAGVAGFVKTLANEIGSSGVTANILSPGYHATGRITQVLDQAAELQEISSEEARKQFVAEVPLQTLGTPDDFAGFAAFLLSPFADYITGATYNVDGGLTRHLTG